ncbi:MAG: DUF1957 domain-containing protein [Myxococcales bacterium]|nr:DUF1957 domain-containing protein [Myxococcales bacterium]
MAPSGRARRRRAGAGGSGLPRRFDPGIRRRRTRAGASEIPRLGRGAPRRLVRRPAAAERGRDVADPRVVQPRRTRVTRLGYLSLVLHAHLPFVRHPDHPTFLEEAWLFEGVLETYIPLLQAFERLERDRIPFRVTMSVSPTLCEMLADPILVDRTHQFLRDRVELARRELDRTRDGPVRGLAEWYFALFRDVLRTYEERWGRDLIAAFRHWRDTGSLEILSCGATHGYLPLMRSNRVAVRAQIRVARENYTKHFGRPPRGIWLPECAYYPGLDQILREEGFDHFVADTHALLDGAPRPGYGNFAPVLCPGSDVAVFARDYECSKQVWSSKEGYPGDPEYREFYRDIGFDLPLEDLKPCVHPDGIRTDTGIKYHRITGEVALGDKALYRPDLARRRAWEHAANFVYNREQQCRYFTSEMDRPALVIAPYDAELFGHWWYEGPLWIENVFRRLAETPSLESLTLEGYLDRHPTMQVVQPAESSWGYRGYHEYWLNGTNDWVYPHLHVIADRMVALARRFQAPSALESRALKQAARELLLAQASDWAFIMTTGTTTEYAIQRTRTHVHRFHRLHEELLSGRIDERELARVEGLDSIFQEINPSVYADG